MSARISPVRPANGSCTTLVYCPRRRPERTALYRLVQHQLEPWLAARREADPDIVATRHIELELRGYLDRGIMVFGFALAYCETCVHDFRVAILLQGPRGMPVLHHPSYGRDGHHHLVEHVFPQVAVRHWVVTFPRRLRFFLHRDPVLLGRGRRSVLRTIESALRRRCPASRTARFGAVRFLQRFGPAQRPHSPALLRHQ